MFPLCHSSVYALRGGAPQAPSPYIFDPIFALNSSVKSSLSISGFWSCSSSSRRKQGGVRVDRMTSNLRTTNHLRHVEPMKKFLSGADKISKLNAVILGEARATEEKDLVFPSEEFASQAHVQSPDQVSEPSG